VTISDPWRLDLSLLEAALTLWKRRRRLGDQRYVDEFLMDLVIDPLACGEEDGDTEVWTGITGPSDRRIVIVYVPTLSTRRVAVADINYG
jgi:hypothetical protein